MELVFLALLVLLMALALGSGFPVAFALPGSAIVTIGAAAAAGYLFAGDVDAYFFQDGPSEWLAAGVTNLRGIYWEADRDTLIAIPLFIFMGIMLQRSKIAEDLLITMAQLFGPVRGGLGISVVFVGALLAATTGIVGATVVAMGLISLPAMLRNNYSPSLATGTIAASGTLGQIIPPSIVLIILADQLASASDQASTARKALYRDATGDPQMPSEFDVVSTSAGEMFLGAMLPGLVLVGLYMLFILLWALVRPQAAPAVAREGDFDRAFLFRLVLSLVPPLTLIFLVLGSILAGIATVNQAGAIGAVGSLLMASYRLTEGQRGSFRPAILALVALAILAFVITRFDTNIKAIDSDADRLGVALGIAASAALMVALVWSAIRAYRIDDTLRQVMIETAKATSLVFIILLGAAMLTAAFRAFGGEELVREFLQGLPGGFWAQFITVMAVIFLLGFFLDFIEIAVVVVPVVAPILLADPSANITAVWLGVMIGLNIQTSFLTPPFGFALFYLRGVAPKIVRTIDMYKGVIAFIALQIVALVIVANYPALVNYLPNRVSLLSETSPPPRNPRLQECLEDYVLTRLEDEDIARPTAALAAADLSSLPEDAAEDLAESLEEASAALAALEAIEATEAEVEAASGAYRPVHRAVREIEADMREIDARIKELRTRASRLRGENVEERRAALEAEAEALAAERDAIAERVPEDWETTRDAFGELVRAEARARNDYRRAADGAYRTLGEIAPALADADALAAADGELETLAARLVDGDTEGLAADLAALATRLEGIAEADSIASDVARAASDLDDEEPDPERALERLDEALLEVDEELAWRGDVDPDLAERLIDYERLLRGTLGIRSQERMTREQALSVARCSSEHEDVSLSF